MGIRHGRARRGWAWLGAARLGEAWLGWARQGKARVLNNKFKQILKNKQKSALEDLLAFQMKAVGLPDFEREYKFHPDRRWRFDFYHESGWGIEINGGGWNKGGHNRNPIAMGRDYEKYNAAQELGIRVLLYTGEQIKDMTAIAQLERIFK